MRFPLRVFAVLTFLGWLFATGHVVLSHGGQADGGAMEAEFDHHDLDDDHGVPDSDDQHHHDLTLVAAGQVGKTVEVKVFAPVWLPLLEVLAAQLRTLVCEEKHSRSTFDFGKSPPDTRMSGWLFVVQTALQVRGPSLAA